MTEREQFEVWATEEGWCNFTRINEGYAVDHLDDAWLAWQASRRAALEKAIAKLEQMADEESTVEYKWAAASIRALAGATET